MPEFQRGHQVNNCTLVIEFYDQKEKSLKPNFRGTKNELLVVITIKNPVLRSTGFLHIPAF